MLIAALPFVAKQECFALKGGTAINLFVRDMPRLSVDIDIDLAYLPVKDRDTSLAEIDNALRSIAADIENKLSSQVTQTVLRGTGKVSKLIVTHFLFIKYPAPSLAPCNMLRCSFWMPDR